MFILLIVMMCTLSIASGLAYFSVLKSILFNDDYYEKSIDYGSLLYSSCTFLPVSYITGYVAYHLIIRI